MISIIIPIYNTEKYLGQCIESVLSQSHRDFELILVDDGSPDRAGSICDQYAAQDPRIRVFHKKNGGVSAARNTGLESAVGEYVTFIDSDDWVEPTYLEGLLREMAPGKMSVAGIVRDNAAPKECSSIRVLNRSEAEISVFSSDGIRGWPFARVFDRKLLNDHHIRFDSNIAMCEDELFNMQYLSCMNGYVVVLDEAKYHYRSNPNGALNGRYCKKTPSKRDFSEILAVERMGTLLDKDVEVQDAWRQKRTKAAAATLRTMVSCHYQNKNEIEQLKKIVRRGCLHYLRGNIGAASSKMSVLLSAISPELEWRIYKRTALRLQRIGG